MTSAIQSVIFSKKYFTKKQAIDFLERNNLKHYKIDEKKIHIDLDKLIQINLIILE